MTDRADTPRARARAATIADIVAEARRQLGEVGAAGLSLRSVARELGMVSSNVYRYFDSRDALLTRLIVDAFDAVGAAAEEAAAGGGDVGARWLRVARAIRTWARANPHDYALVYGSPVPGYRAPEDTIGPAARVSLVMLRLVADGVRAGQVAVTPGRPVPPAVRSDFRRLAAVEALELPDEVMGRAMLVWVGLFGAISYELFGHLQGVVDDGDAWFDHEMRRAGDVLVGPAALVTPGGRRSSAAAAPGR